ncbi:60S ribosomal protein L7 [Anopheles nili]|uniref:60S ribosomal protein L7 n=1 Tax=Anopheles nili TaxID=185578 RepID=UPI00237BD5EA|nr:60S ribosomal protein L7 [Anopheles nili]
MEKYIIPNKLPSTEVNVLSHRTRRLRQLAKRTEPTPGAKKKRTSFRKVGSIVANSRIADRDAKRIKRNFLKRGIFSNEQKFEDNHLVLVYRHRGKNIYNKDVMKTMIRLGLQFVRSATFHRLTPEVIAQLKVIEPFVIWGYPNITVVRNLLYKYVRLRCDNTGEESTKPVPLTSNKQVEDLFGSLGMLCVDDLVHEIMTVGPHFDAVREKLRSFLVKDPVGGWKNDAHKGKLRSIGGEAGFRGEKINELFQKIL